MCTLGVIGIQEAEDESSWQEGSYARYHAPPLLSTDRSLAHESHPTKQTNTRAIGASKMCSSTPFHRPVKAITTHYSKAAD